MCLLDGPRTRLPPVPLTGGTIRTLDLGERCVLPGFTDSHVHFPTWSLGLRQARLEGARSLEEALDRVVAARGRVASAGARAIGPRRPPARRSTARCRTCPWR